MAVACRSIGGVVYVCVCVCTYVCAVCVVYVCVSRRCCGYDKLECGKSEVGVQSVVLREMGTLAQRNGMGLSTIRYSTVHGDVP